MKRKLFELPRLKIGGTKADAKATKNGFGDDLNLDSPPATPMSVRPPLTPKTEYDLRTACALVLREYKPSHRIYREQYGKSSGTKRRTDEEVVEQVAERDTDADATPSTAAGNGAQLERTKDERRVDEDTFSRDTQLQTKRTTDNLIDDDSWERMRAERGAPVERSKQTTEAKARTRSKLRKWSASIPEQTSSISSSKTEVVERPSTAPKSDSTIASGSTDDTGFEWTGSTAPTTAAVTPNRTWSNALQPTSANNSVPKFLASDGEWMRQELDRHKRLCEETRARQDLEDQVTASLDKDATTATRNVTSPAIVIPPSPVVRVPTRKSMPDLNGDARQGAPPYQRLESRPSADLRRSTSQKRRQTPRSESGPELELLRDEGRQTQADDPPPLPRMGDISIYRPAVPAPPKPSVDVDVADASRRSRSITRRFRGYTRSDSKNSSRKDSVDISRSESRARSIDSVRSAVSALTPSIDSATSKWQDWKPFSRKRDGANSVGITRAISKASSLNSIKARAMEMEGTQALHQGKGKPPINLNRELPPLPSLDMWNPELWDSDWQPEEPSKPVHIASLEKNENTRSSPSSRVPKASIDSTSSKQQPRDSVLNDGSRGHARHISQCGAPIDPLLSDEQAQTSAHHPKRTTSLRAPREPSHYPIPDTTTTLESTSRPTSPSCDLNPAKTRRRSKSISENDESKDNPSDLPTPEKPLGRNHIVNYSRMPRQPLRASSVRQGPTVPKSSIRVVNHTRAVSEQQQVNFSRKISSDDFVRMYDARFRDEAAPAKSDGEPPALPTKERPKRRWWRAISRAKRQDD